VIRCAESQVIGGAAQPVALAFLACLFSSSTAKNGDFQVGSRAWPIKEHSFRGVVSNLGVPARVPAPGVPPTWIDLLIGSF
jgi:hypothetical protein